MGKVCCFTGHREIAPASLQKGLEQTLRNEIVQAILDGYDTFLAGGAIGFDTMAAYTVEALKQEHPQIRLVLALPCQNQSAYWSAEQIAIYEKSLAFADEVVYVSQTYSSGCMRKRNAYMVEHSQRCIYYLKQSRGGTYSTVQMATRGGLELCPCGGKSFPQQQTLW